MRVFELEYLSAPTFVEAYTTGEFNGLLFARFTDELNAWNEEKEAKMGLEGMVPFSC